MSPPAVVVLGGFLTTAGLYRDVQATLTELTGAKVFVVPLTRRHWVSAVSASGWAAILHVLHRTTRAAFEAAEGCRVTLVGHSSGGVMGRLYLSPDPFQGHRFRGLDAVERLITLGSPHLNRRGARLRRWVDETYPGAYFAPDVTYTAVGGRAVRGDPSGTVKERTAYRLYRYLSGDGHQWGDGLVPLQSARLPDALNREMDDVAHAPVGGATWYGSPEVVRRWWKLALGRGLA